MARNYTDPLVVQHLCMLVRRHDAAVVGMVYQGDRRHISKTVTRELCAANKALLRFCLERIPADDEVDACDPDKAFSYFPSIIPFPGRQK